MLRSQSKICSDFSSSEFLFAVSHELKTPLNAIIGFADILNLEMNNIQKSKTSTPNNKNLINHNSFVECMDCISEINHAALEMKELVHDLLDVGAASSGNFSVDLSKKIEVRDTIKRSVNLNHDYALKRNVSLKTEIAADVNLINLDTKRMKQILTNLISNAVKYSPKHSEIKITAKNLIENNQKFLEISITDQGFGMTPAQVETAFQKYQTIQNPHSGTVDSFGLGLPIVKHLVEQQNGTIEIKSELNRGTEIKLKFPYLM